MAQLMRSQLETYPNQLRRLIADAVLAFGFDQGLLLRRQRALACWRLVTIQEYELIPSATSCMRARAQLFLSAGKNPVSAAHPQHPIPPAFNCQASCPQQLTIWPLAANHPALSSRSSGPHQPIIWPLAANQQTETSHQTAANHPDS